MTKVDSECDISKAFIGGYIWCGDVCLALFVPMLARHHTTAAQAYLFTNCNRTINVY